MRAITFKLFVFLSFFTWISLINATTHEPEEFLSSISGSPDEGAQIVKHYCASCHALKPLIPVGAPRINELDEWKPRVNAGIHNLLQHSYEGLNLMPPRGGCFECTDKQIMLSILFMLPKELQEDLLKELKAP